MEQVNSPIRLDEYDLLVELLNERRLKMLKMAIEKKDDLYAQEAVRSKNLISKLRHQQNLRLQSHL